MAVAIERREFLKALCGAGAIGVMPSKGQSREGLRTIGFLMGLADDAESQVRIKAFEERLEQKGWTIGQNVRIEYRFAAGNSDRMKAFAEELVELQPDVLVGHSTPVVTELVKATRTIPIVFVVVADPVGSGFAKSVPRPGGNATGFTVLAAPILGKLLTILRQIKPNLLRVALMFNPDSLAPESVLDLYKSPFEAAASSFALQAVAMEVRSPTEIERRMTDFASKPNAGLIVMPDNFLTVHRHQIITLTTRLHLPTIYTYRYFVEAGGLMSYGVDVTDLFRRAPEYVSRILRGENPAELPLQAPTKFELAINLKTAKALGLRVPKILLAGADVLIQ